MVIVLDFRTVIFQKVISYVVMEVIQGANSNPGIEHLSIRIVHATLPRKYHRMYFWEGTVKTSAHFSKESTEHIASRTHMEHMSEVPTHFTPKHMASRLLIAFCTFDVSIIEGICRGRSIIMEDLNGGS